ncbi:MAG: hypothetical protein JAY85_11220 [Candidatus Thiodiazotropha weberae]|uniref:hypothetical protein n=1 Tax=Candidatus Thiodiazotropha endoloripes TaxID=1818881 RepID=UPI00083CA7EF|nr:hypothetical protein [Candidatus Thiodiazotropha endoloripes]MCG7899016.1 hypothetical protein [Candidatus Thiodiazotropha weberae]ODB91744.1 hypothetical protein A3195_03940 [Candidatus Thiodiazotropha endoloripes]
MKDEYNEELRRRLLILRDYFKEGKISISNDVDIEGSLLAVQYGPDGKVDLSTVDAKVRSLALAITAMHDREEMKKGISLYDIQEAYFHYIESSFGKYYRLMKEKGLDPDDIGRIISGKEEYRNEILPSIPEIVSFVKEFWEIAGETAWVHMEDMNCLKGVYGGDLFPSYEENIASKCGIYTDTIIIPDPFIRSAELFERWTEEDKVYYLMKHATSVLEYKDLALADVENPIVVVLPDPAKQEYRHMEIVQRLGMDDVLIHGQHLFGRTFESFEEYIDFCSCLDTPEKVLSELKEKERLLFDVKWGNSAKNQLKMAIEDEYSLQLLGTNHPGIIVGHSGYGRMTQANEILIKSRRFRGVPLIDAPTSWQYLDWKLEYDSDRVDKNHLEDMHITRGLQNLARGEMQWLGKVPASALIEVRREGALDEIRNILSTGISELIELNPHNYHRSSDQIFENLYTAFDEHNKNIKKLTDKKWKFAGCDIGAWLAIGTLEVTAAATGMPVFGISAIAANQLVDIPKLKDIPEKFRMIAEEDEKVKKSPVGLLFKYSNKS